MSMKLINSADNRLTNSDKGSGGVELAVINEAKALDGQLCGSLVTCHHSSDDAQVHYLMTLALNSTQCHTTLSATVIFFASAAVAVDSSCMTVSSSASWSRFSPPSNFVNGHVSTMCHSELPKLPSIKDVSQDCLYYHPILNVISISLVIHGLRWTVSGQVKAHVMLTCTNGVWQSSNKRCSRRCQCGIVAVSLGAPIKLLNIRHGQYWARWLSSVGISPRYITKPWEPTQPPALSGSGKELIEWVGVLRPIHKIDHFLAWYEKTKPNTIKAHIRQLQEIYYNTK